MKIAVTASGTGLESSVDPKFGRASFIILVDSENFGYEVLDNKENANALKGAGIQAARSISEAGAQVLLTGHCGPNAFKALNAAKIGVANNASGTIREAVENYLKGALPLSTAAEVEGQW